MEFKVNHLNEIDWDEIYAAEDCILWDNRKWIFSDYTGHYPAAGGPVIETDDEPKRYYDSQNGLELRFFPFDGSFLCDGNNANIEFLLPANWGEEQLKKWFEQYKDDRTSQENVRQEMLNIK